MNPLFYSVRRMVRSLGWATMVILMIALAIGSNLGVFAVTQSVFMHPLGIPGEDALVRFTIAAGTRQLPFSGQDYVVLRDLGVDQDLLAWKSAQFRVRTPDGTSKVSGAFVSGNAFSVLQLKPFLGRLLRESDDVTEGGREGWSAVLSYSWWRTHVNSDPNVVGRYITVDRVPVRIVGVLPVNFTGLMALSPADIVVPRHFEQIANPGTDRFAKPYYFEWIVLGRLSHGVTLQSLRARLRAVDSVFRQSADPRGLFTEIPAGSLISAEDGREGLASAFKALRSPILAMEFLAVLLLIFCSSNLILLFIARSRREVQASAIRIALGARLQNEIRLVLLEAAILSCIGCLIAIPIADSAASILSLIIESVSGFSTFPAVHPAGYLWFPAVVIALAISSTAASATCIWNTRNHASLAVRGGRSRAGNRTANWVIGFELFASILLVTLCFVDTIGLKRLSAQPSGFDEDSVIASIDLSGPADAAGGASRKETTAEELTRILNQIGNSPGVRSVATINVAPLNGISASGTVAVRDANGILRQQQIWPADVSTQYFSTVGTRIIRGRDFTKADVGGDPVCILSNRAAVVLFSGRDPLGKYLYSSGEPYCRVTGVAEDAHFRSLADTADSVVYRLSRNAFANVIVKASSNTLAIEAIRNTVRTNAPDAFMGSIETVQMRVDDDLREWKLITLSGVFCALVAALILGIGLFGVLSLQIAERQHDIGIQIALGANSVQVCRAVLARMRGPVLIGFLLGSVVAISAAHRFEIIYSLSTESLIDGYLCAAILIVLLSCTAAFVPLNRALKISPMECLTSE